ncbi:hypothetical protein F2Q70_00039821 [Brassica cretica]|uniref:Uncharacterized protein n=1 Tax=Brassica cretica TaxID=69181 RepID=A0A8S9KEB8_BRACR|nr:hypothetical protein F2Q70_00039821 [Brassica cretica]
MKIRICFANEYEKSVTFVSFKVSKDIKYGDKQPIIPWGPRYFKSSINDMLINLAITTVFSAWIAIQRSVEYKPLQFMSFVFVYIIFEKLKSFEAPSSPTYNEEGEENGRELRMGKRLNLQSLSLVFGSILVHLCSWYLFYFNSKKDAYVISIQRTAYTGILNVIEYMGISIPIALYNNQEEGAENGRGLRMGKRLLRSLSLVFGSILFASLAYTGILNVIEYMGSSIPIALYNNQELIVTASSALMLYVMASYYR